VDLNRLGGIVVKGLSLEPMAGSPAPRLCDTPSGMLNAVGLQNVGVRAFLAEKLPALRQYRTAVIANVFGYTVDEYVRVIRILEDAEGLAAYELNISCPNTAHGGIQFGTDPQMVSEVISAARQAARRPLWVKLSPNVTDITAIAREAEAAGADALAVINTVRGIAIDVETWRPRLGNITGGLSGPAIRPIAVLAVYEIAQAVQIPIVGQGGIENLSDALEFFLAGAAAISIGTANFTDPRIPERIVSELQAYLAHRNLASLDAIVGKANVELSTPDQYEGDEG